VEGENPILVERLVAAQADVRENVRRLQDARTRLRVTRQQMRTGREGRQALHESEYARLTARLESLPVIEQAKGVLIAQTGCDPDEAFELLKSASQRANVKVRDLAADIVRRAASAGAPPGESSGSVSGGGSLLGDRRRPGGC